MGKKYNKGRGGNGSRGGGTAKHAAKPTVKKGSKARTAGFVHPLAHRHVLTASKTRR